MILSVPVGMVLINMCQAGAFDYIFNDVEILVEGVLGLHENEEKIQEEKRRKLMTETLEKKGMNFDNRQLCVPYFAVSRTVGKAFI